MSTIDLNPGQLFAKSENRSPVEAIRDRSADDSIANTTLSTGVESRAYRGDRSIAVEGLGADTSYGIQNDAEGEKELGNVGAVLSKTRCDGLEETYDGKVVVRAWKDPLGSPRYYQYDASDNKVLAPPSSSQKQGWSAVFTADGNLGIFEDEPCHRLHIRDGGADVGDYLILGGKKLEVIDGDLIFDGCKVKLAPKKCHCHRCRHKYHYYH